MPGAGYFTAKNAAAVTPHDTNPLSRGKTAALYVGGAGALIVRMAGESADTTFAAVPAGTTLPIQVTHVRSTGTVATSIVALY
jgi:hypothetical protein